MRRIERPEALRRRVLRGVTMLFGLLVLATAAMASDRPLQLAKSSGGWFGVRMMDLSPESAAARGFDDGRGILLLVVVPGSPAARANLRPGDIILEIDGRRLLWFKSMAALITSRPPGKDVGVLFERAGKRLRTLVELGDLERARARVRSREAMSRDYGTGLKAYQAGRHREAAKIFEGLVDHGWTDARFALGFLYAQGEGRPRNHAQAARWYRLAAEQGQVSAQRNLGLLYWNGEGVTRDYVHAYYWIKRAADGGDEYAREDEKKLRGQMSGRQIARAKDWLRYQPRKPSGRELKRLRAANTSTETRPAGPASDRQAAKVRAPDSQVRQVQIMLDGLGYQPGPADGLMGRRTRSAIKQYQRDRGLTADGEVDQSLVASLRSARTSLQAPARSDSSAEVSAAPATGAPAKRDSLEGLDEF